MLSVASTSTHFVLLRRKLHFNAQNRSMKRDLKTLWST